MKRLVLLLFIVIVGIIGLVEYNKEEISVTEEYYEMFERTFEDIMDLYAVTSPILMTEEEDIDKAVKEINDVIERLNDESLHFFSEEARELVIRMTSCAKNAIENQKCFLDNEYSGEFKQKVMDEITEMSDLMRAYARIYDDFMENKY